MAVEYTNAPSYGDEDAAAASGTAEAVTSVEQTDECTWKQLSYEGEGQGYADDIDAEFDDIYIVDGPNP